MCKILSFDDRPKPPREFRPTPGPSLQRWYDQWPTIVTVPDEPVQVPA